MYQSAHVRVPLPCPPLEHCRGSSSFSFNTPCVPMFLRATPCLAFFLTDTRAARDLAKMVSFGEDRVVAVKTNGKGYVCVLETAAMMAGWWWWW